MIKDYPPSGMTQEDVWRELELLPVWQTRLLANTQSTEPVALPLPPPLASTEPPVLDAAVAWTQVSSVDGLCVFVVAGAPLSADAWQLLQNMAKAMRMAVTAPQAITEPLNALPASPAKMLIAFGEAVAQRLLASPLSLATLRGQRHPCYGKTLVATHDLAHLLQQPLDKAQTWQDLRLAMQVLADLP